MILFKMRLDFKKEFLKGHIDKDSYAHHVVIFPKYMLQGYIYILSKKPYEYNKPHFMV